jgi:Cu(I)/Ag(I) efflux system membrane protein CusA/SilA
MRLAAGGDITANDVQVPIDGSVLRRRPKLMTVTVVMASLVPILRSTGVGADVMKPSGDG